MKLLIALFAFVAVPSTLASFGPDFIDVLHGYENNCSQKSGLDSCEIEKIRGNGRNVALPANNELVNQWAKCMLQEYNVIKSDDTINTDVTKLTLLDDTISYAAAFPNCKNKIGKDIAETARLMWDCYNSETNAFLMAPMTTSTKQ